MKRTLRTLPVFTICISLVLLISVLSTGETFGQQSPDERAEELEHVRDSLLQKLTANPDRIAAGIGMGIDMGGLGISYLVYPHQNIGLFGSVGFAIGGFGASAGIKARATRKDQGSRLIPFGLLIYGVNAAVVVVGASEYNRVFYGPAAGIGCDLRSRRARRGYMSLAMIVPFNRKEAKEYIDELFSHPNITGDRSLSPVGFSVGYKFILK